MPSSQHTPEDPIGSEVRPEPEQIPSNQSTPSDTESFPRPRRGSRDENPRGAGQGSSFREGRTCTVIGSARIISGCTFLSRVLGFIRDMLCAGFFGMVWDAFIFAFTIPNLFRRLFGEGALSAAFIPTFSHYLQNESRQETLRFMNAMITLLFSFLVLIAFIIFGLTFFIPVLAQDKEFYGLFSKLLRIMIGYLPLICLVALLAAILNSLKHFTMPALASVVLNICWISGFIIAAFLGRTDIEKITIIAWAILIGGVFEVLIQIPPLIKKKIGYRPRWLIAHPGVKEVTRLMIPTMIGLAIVQINLMLDYVIAMIFIPEGGISALYFGNRLMQFPLALIGISIATAVFPFLAEYVAKKDMEGMKKELGNSLRFCLFMALPASIGLIVLAHPIIALAFQILPRTLFGLKGFSSAATDRTVLVLIFYALGISAYAGLQIITRAFYSFKDMKTPVRIGLKMIVLNLILNILLVQWLKEGGIALATALTAGLNLILLLFALDTKIGAWAKTRILGSFLKALTVSLLMGVICYFVLNGLPSLNLSMGKWQVFMQGMIRVLVPLVVGIGLYSIISWFLQREELKQVWQGIRIRKRKV